MEKLKLKDIDKNNINIKTIKGLYYGYKEVINYLVFGVLTTVVNFLCYFLFARILNIEEVTSNALSWFFSVLFAYLTNKLFVFESKTNTIGQLLKEVGSFFLARILSGIFCDVGTFAVMVKILHINDVFSKIVTQVMVVVANYIFSKFIVFKKKDKKI